MAILFGLVGGLALWYWGAPNPDHILKKSSSASSSSTSQETRERIGHSGDVAKDYAFALQQGRCDDVVAVTLWMIERLDYVRETTADAQAVRRARQALCTEIQTRNTEGNQLSLEGIEDKYIFAPGAIIEVMEVEQGRQDLAKPGAKLVWLLVRYPSKDKALRDISGYAISSLRVGVNLSQDGYVLKAGVRGVLDIDWDSLSFRWSEEV